MSSIASVSGSSEALNTVTTPSSAGSTSSPTVSSMRITSSPAVASAPALGKVTFCLMRSASPRVNSGVEERIRSRSRVTSLESAMSSGAGDFAGSSSIGVMRSQASPFFPSGGSPLPKPLSCIVQSIVLKWSPES